MKNKRNTTLALIIMFFAILGVDQLFKWIAATYLQGTQGVVLIRGLLELQYVENTGAAFGTFLNQNGILVAVNLVLIALLLLVFTMIPRAEKWDKLRYAGIFLLGGATGNLIDRFMHGYVVDFIRFVPFNFPTFNLSDACVTVSVIVIVIFVIFSYSNTDLNEMFKKKLKITLRLEESKDYHEVEALTREAFWTVSDPVNEHLLAHKLRDLPSFMKELDYVAEANGKLVGNIMYSKAKIVGEDGRETEVLTFGPLSVLPEYQNKGVGKTLMEKTIEEAKKTDYPMIVIYGEPDYYPRYGFVNAAEYGITAPDGKNFDALMALPLTDEEPSIAGGKFHEDKVFTTLGGEETAEFDKKFPEKEKYAEMPITELLIKLPKDEAEIFVEKGIKTVNELRRFSGREISGWSTPSCKISDGTKKIIDTELVSCGVPKRKWPFEAEL